MQLTGGPSWATGCDLCTNGLIDPPDLEWGKGADHLTVMDHRRAQLNAGVLQFCECRAGAMFHRVLTTARPEYRTQEEIIEENKRTYEEFRRRNIFTNAGIPPKYRDYTLKGFVKIAGNDPGKQAAINACVRYHAEGGLIEGDSPKVGILLHGEPGVGKTGVLSPLFVHYMQEGYSGLWVQYNELMAALRDFESGQTEDRMREAQTVDYLFIDDFGDPASNRAASPWAQDCMFRIIDHRNNHRLPVFVTTNLDLDKMSDQFHRRLTRRLSDSCAMIHMAGQPLDGPDLRPYLERGE